jgi:tetratricopeptide (TPR) repeat protein
MKIAFAFFFAIGLILAGPCSSAPAYGFFAEGAQLNVDQALSIAEKHYEIAKLLIKEGRYDRVLPEMRKILDLNLQGDYEQTVAESSTLIARLLAESKQTSLAHELLDETIARMKQCGNIASLLKIKAYFYKSEGKLQKAIETFERAVDIERQCAQQ